MGMEEGMCHWRFCDEAVDGHPFRIVFPEEDGGENLTIECCRLHRWGIHFMLGLVAKSFLTEADVTRFTLEVEREKWDLDF